MDALCFAYYCSGHGYGHATRVSALARHLRNLDPKPIIHIVSSAPRHVFEDSIKLGALYRYAEIDPVIVQPIAYGVDRRKSIEVLESFLNCKDILLEQERAWLVKIRADCVLSDAAFLGCLAANSAGLPSALITNFTFDAVYSYLSTSYTDHGNSPPGEDVSSSLSVAQLVPDEPIPDEEITCLVQEIYNGYRCADLLVRLPGCIPIPSFVSFPALPSPSWTDQDSNTLLAETVTHLTQSPSLHQLHPSIPFPHPHLRPKPIQRTVIQAPLLVRGITQSSESVYTSSGRSRFLSSIGIPEHLHDPQKTKILIVSFGGQVFRRPSSSRNSRAASLTPSLRGSPRSQSSDLSALSNQHIDVGNSLSRPVPNSYRRHLERMHIQAPQPLEPIPCPPLSSTSPNSRSSTPASAQLRTPPDGSPTRLATPSHIFIPGAPPVSKPEYGSPTGIESIVHTLLASEELSDKGKPFSYFDELIMDLGLQDAAEELDPQLLPDSSWIAIVCGVSKEQWSGDRDDGTETSLPDGFYVAPKYVYMPDLTAVADVLLGKLGYGTVSECIDSCTPFVYVSRPLFVEEHGLRLLLSQEGVGMELSRAAYEAGDWARAVDKAWSLGQRAKATKRQQGKLGIGSELRDEEGRVLATQIVDWVRTWHTDSETLSQS
ncbi:hypothetical protein BJ138DRAFT_1014196 [Hygrophoropsis aurantiaca]|uniref:Uncharacterized protein n=1 Tax=Hygrophoropsis aurantiaca TaxID=72124 RepID=A0ACB8A2H4_9AGAM|nr:hypothetical protein BJ138DRAFT_1014196 [Hygrophoropsis aurantiaca]